MLRSDEPCAIATTLMPPEESAEKTREAMPGAPAIPSPTTAMTPSRARGDVVDEASGQFVAERGAQALHGALASPSGSVKPIELSEDAWKMVETESRSASTPRTCAPRCRGPDHALAGDGDDRLSAHDRDRFDGIGRVRAFGRHLRARLMGVDERADVQRDARTGDRDERTRVQDLGAVVRDLGRLPMMELRDEPRVGDEPRIGGQDSRDVLPQHDALGAEGARQQGGRQVGAPAAERRDAAIRRPPDEAGDHGSRARTDERSYALTRQPSGGREVGRGAAVVVVGDDNVHGVKVRRAPPRA
jgi:hypothetical protein